MEQKVLSGGGPPPPGGGIAHPRSFRCHTAHPTAPPRDQGRRKAPAAWKPCNHPHHQSSSSGTSRTRCICAYTKGREREKPHSRVTTQVAGDSQQEGVERGRGKGKVRTVSYRDSYLLNREIQGGKQTHTSRSGSGSWRGTTGGRSWSF